MDAGRLKRALPVLIPAAALTLGLLAGALLLRPGPAPAPPPAPEARAIADAALLSVREEGRLVGLTARFVAVVSAHETHLGMTARKTLIMPGTVRYGVDLSRLRRQDLAWDAPTRTLTITLPPLEIAGPDIDFDSVQNYSDGGLLMALIGGEDALDDENRRRGRAELLRQARDPAPVAAARAAAMRIVARGFAAPLRAAGIDASVAVRFVDTAGREEASFLDRPRRIENAIEDRRAGPHEGDDRR